MRPFRSHIIEATEPSLCDMMTTDRFLDDGEEIKKLKEMVTSWKLETGDRKEMEDYFIKTIFGCKTRSRNTKHTHGPLYRGVFKSWTNFDRMGLTFRPNTNPNSDRLHARGRYRSAHRLTSWTNDEEIARNFLISPKKEQSRFSVGILMSYTPPPERTFTIDRMNVIAAFREEREVIVHLDGAVDVDFSVSAKGLMEYLILSSGSTSIDTVSMATIAKKLGKGNAEAITNHPAVKAFLKRRGIKVVK